MSEQIGCSTTSTYNPIVERFDTKQITSPCVLIWVNPIKALSTLGNMHLSSVLIIGAGPSGLTAAILLSQSGHAVTVVEHKETPLDPGYAGGLGISINAIRVLERIGLGKAFEEIALYHPHLSIRRYDTGEVIAEARRKHQQRMFHRPDFLRILYNRAVELGITFHLGSKIRNLDLEGMQPTVTLENGRTLTADILLGADGSRSQVRHTLFPEADQKPTKELTWIVSVPPAAFKQDAEAMAEYRLPNCQCWFGPQKLVICWTMKGHDVYHLQLVDFSYNPKDYGIEEQPDGRPPVGPFHNMNAIRTRFSDFAPAIRQLFLSAADSCVKWRHTEVPPLPRWSNDRGTALLLGDAAHAFAPFTGQGVSQGFEDAATLCELLSLAKSADQLPQVARAYEAARLPRLARIKAFVDYNGVAFSLPDGPKQEMRDQILKAEYTDDGAQESSTTATTRYSRQEWAWLDDYDPVAEARSTWRQTRL